MSFGENLQFLRKKNHVTQEQLAERLEVSRQSISKWESDTTFPEMEKILQICDMFSCSMDALLRGNVQDECAEDTADYDRHMNQFSRYIAAGIFTVILGMSANQFLEALEVPEQIGEAAFLLFVLIGVSFFVIAGVRHEDYKKKYPQIVPFYRQEQIDAYHHKFPVYIVAGIACVLAGLILVVLGEGLAGCDWYREEYFNALFFVGVAFGGALLSYAGMQRDKFDVEKYNRENQSEKEKNGQSTLIGVVCGCIMIAATIVFFIWGFLFGAWMICWIVYPIGGMLCGMATLILSHARK